MKFPLRSLANTPSLRGLKKIEGKWTKTSAQYRRDVASARTCAEA